MISTVTTSTVTTVATATFAASLTLVAVLGLLILLIQKEVVSSSEGHVPTGLSKALNIAIVPLLLSFLFIVFVKVAEVLN
ncbi:MAG: hypothetical protein ACK2U1_23575 [Anaerolineales bacterium]|jgi:hypothetical protein